ncbi:MAG: PPOX class F420-dependent oxidoreductase [Actinomycetota bacterium]
MTPMSDDEVVEFMRTGSRTGKLAVTRKDGSPHVTPIWFDFDDATGELVFLTQVETIKGKSLRRDGRVSICVDLMEMPFHFARIDGEVASLTPQAEDPDAMLHWAIETCRRYVGDNRAEEFGRRNAHPSETLVRVRPIRYLGAWGVSD